MEFKRTVTTIFMVPTLGFPRDALLGNGFINGYSKDGGREVQCENCIYLLFKPKNIDKFRVFLENQYATNNNIVEDYDYEGGYVVVVYKLNKEFEKDFSIVRKSKYSKTSKKFQELFSRIIKLRPGKDEISLQYRIFNKTEDLVKFWEDKFDVEFDKNQEVWKGWDDDDETLYINKIEEKSKI